MRDVDVGPLTWRVGHAILAVIDEFPVRSDSVRGKVFRAAMRGIVRSAVYMDRAGRGRAVAQKAGDELRAAIDDIMVSATRLRGQLSEDDLRWLRSVLEALAGYLSMPTAQEVS